MLPTLREKDFVMIDHGRTRIIDGLIYALRLDDTIMVKRLRLKPSDKIEIISDNREELKHYEVHACEVHVIGQVIWSCRSYLTGV